MVSARTLGVKMPDKDYSKIKVIPSFNRSKRGRNIPDYAELQVTSNFSFLVGASHPEELVAKAAELGTKAIAITDYNSLAGVVRAHITAKNYPIQFIVGTRLEVEIENAIFSILVYPTNRNSYGKLCRLLTLGKKHVTKDRISLKLEDFFKFQSELITTIIPPYLTHDYEKLETLSFEKACSELKDNASDPSFVSLAIHKTYSNDAKRRFEKTVELSGKLSIPLVVTNDVHFHEPSRYKLQQVLTCIKNKVSLEKAGFLLFQNAERFLKSPKEMQRLFRHYPQALKRTIELSEMAAFFSLDELRYEYPNEIYPDNLTPSTYLKLLVESGLKERYGENISCKVKEAVKEELKLIEELEYEKYFLTCYDIVKFARNKNILCQGRGAAANSVVCFVLGITSVDPTKVDLLFARFVSKERTEPPDIDIDFEHERREEVIQYIYEKFGRDYAGLTGGIVTYRHRSAIREVGKALGLSLEVVDKLAKGIHRWTDCEILKSELQALKLDAEEPVFKNVFALTKEILGFPRHLTQHVGGFIICKNPLCETVPIVNAAMEGRTIVEWDKDDIEALGILKIDVLALGMLTCVRKAFELINARRKENSQSEIALYSVPPEDQETYQMISKADTVGVFQVESRAQMSMLPRLKPKTFYDLVIQVAIVRPGPIQGNMVHPYLKRRNGLKKPNYPDKRVEEILGKTLGVPLFQEQAMRLAIVLAGFTPGEAEALRRAMASWKRNEHVIAAFKERIVIGMRGKGYSLQFAETCISQLKGFAEYGFPESHAASFALITYASCWIKCHYPAEFLCALLNSQPLGFYSPSQLIIDAKAHGIIVKPLDINHSNFDCSMEEKECVRIGLRYVKGILEKQILILTKERMENGPFISILSLWQRCYEKGLSKSTLFALAKADGFNSLNLNSREAIFAIQSFIPDPAPIEMISQVKEDKQIALPLQSTKEKMFQDYRQTGFSLKAHPIEFIRDKLKQAGVLSAAFLKTMKLESGKRAVSVAGLSVIRQRPGTAKGMCFIMLEDETGSVNLVIKPDIFEKFSRDIIMSTSLIASGSLDRVGEVVYVTVENLRGLDKLVLDEPATTLPSSSYSY